MMNELISIVIPIYKVESLLKRCLDSVINQTYKNLEIILVDDGSPDKCGIICDDYALRDNRIRVIHKKNGGLSSARNSGIQLSTGKYITFIDSDDMITEDFIEVLYKNINKYNSQISICGYEFITETDFSASCKTKKEKNYVFLSDDALKQMLYQKKINNSAWGKLYLKTIFDELKYPEGKIYEDIPVTYKTFLKSNKICVTTKKCYLYTKRKESISSSFNEKTFDIIDNINILNNDLKNIDKLKKAVNSRVLNADFFVIRQIDKTKYPEIYEKLMIDIKKRRIISLFDIKTRLKTKIGIIISFFGIDMLKKMYNQNKELKIVKKLD